MLFCQTVFILMISASAVSPTPSLLCQWGCSMRWAGPGARVTPSWDMPLLMGCHSLGSELGGQSWGQVTGSNDNPDTARAEPGPGSGLSPAGSSRRQGWRQGWSWTLQHCAIQGLLRRKDPRPGWRQAARSEGLT